MYDITSGKVLERFFTAKYSPQLKLHTFLFEKAIKRLILVYNMKTLRLKACKSKIAKCFGTKTYLGTKILCDQKILGPKFFLGPKKIRTKNLSGPKIFRDP